MRTLALALVAVLALVAPPAATTPLPGATADLDMVCALYPNGFLRAQNHTAQARRDSPVGFRWGDDGTGTSVRTMFLGMAQPFAGLVIDVTVAAEGREDLPPGTPEQVESGTTVYTYSARRDDGVVTWRLLPVQDETDGFHRDGVHTIAFEAPPDWVPFNPIGDPACPGAFFYVKASTGANYVTAALVSQVSAILEGSP